MPVVRPFLKRPRPLKHPSRAVVVCLAGLLPAFVLSACVLAAFVLMGGVHIAVAEDALFRCVIEPAKTVRVGSSVVGLLRDVPVERGDLVEAGQRVAELDSSVELATLDLVRLRATNDAEVSAARAQSNLARKQMERAEQLVARQVASAETVDERRATLEVTRQRLRQAELEQEVLKLEVARSEAVVAQRRVVSPIDGVVTERKLSAGEYVHQEAYILEIAQLNPLYVEVYLPIALYGQVVPGMQGQVHPQEPISGRYAAKVVIVDRVLDAASGTFGVRLELPNADFKLPAGIRCDVSFAGIAPDDGAVLPR